MILKEIVESKKVIEDLMEVKLPIAVSYKLNKVYKKVVEENKSFEEKRLELIKTYGEQTDKEKDTWTVKQENVDQFFKELEELTKVEVDIEFPKIKLSELQDITIEPKKVVPWLFEE